MITTSLTDGLTAQDTANTVTQQNSALAKGRSMKNLAIPSDVHREMKIASVHRDEDIRDLLCKMWNTFKRVEGDRLHERVSEKQEVA